MPKPSRRRQLAPIPERLDHVFQDEWVDDWTDVAEQLARLLKLPDLHTRSGLKKVHANLSSFQLLLDETFRLARHRGQMKIMAAVVGIYTQLCTVDAVLQDKILEHGFYDRLVTLADYEDTRAVSLRALGTISLLTGREGSSHFLKGAPSVLKLALKHLDHSHTLHAITGFFAHSSLSLRALETSFDITALGRALLDSFRRSPPSHWLFDHAMLCFNADLYDMAKKCRHMPSFVRLHVAFLHSQDYMRRVRAMDCILRMGLEELNKPKQLVITQKSNGCCPTTVALADGVKFEDLPPKLLQAAEKYGRDRTHIFATQHSRVRYASLYQEWTHNADPCKIGRELADLILNYQFPLPDVYCDCGRLRECDECFPKLKWPELVNKCMEELRKQISPSDEDTLAADILQWKLQSYHMQASCDYGEAMASKHPSCALFYYHDAQRQHIDPSTLFRRACEGSNCKDMPDWLSHGLHATMAEACFDMALSMGRSGEKNSYLMMLSARQEAKLLLDEAPPDDLRRPFYLSIYVLSQLVLEGPAMDFRKPTMKRAMKEMDLAVEFAAIMRAPTLTDKCTAHVEVAQILRSLLPEALGEWSVLLHSMDDAYLENKNAGRVTSCSIEQPLPDDYEKLSVWLHESEKARDTKKLDGGNDENVDEDEKSHMLVELMTCSWCGRPSAALRKCKGCGNERYCDTRCQKYHWEDHKAKCRSAQPLPITEETES